MDGYVDDNARWKSSGVAGPHTLTIELEESSRLGSAHVYSGSATTVALSNFTLQYYNGTTWLDIPGGTVTGNTNAQLRVKFTTPVSSSRVRMYIPGSGTTAMRVKELVIFAAQAGQPDDYPIGTDVVLGAASGIKYDRRADDYWAFVNRDAGQALVADASGASLGATTNVLSHYQLLYNLDSDTYRLRNRDSFLCIAAKTAGTTSGTKVVEQSDYNAMPHELWRLEDLGTGYFRIINVWNGLAMEADNSNPVNVTLQTPSASNRQQWQIQWLGTAPKKGHGGWDDSYSRFRSNWFYNWGRTTGTWLPASVTFNPMQHNKNWPGFGDLYQSRPGWLTSSKAAWMLGFNEPDHTDQANMTTDEAIALWPQLEQTDIPLASPVAASAFGGWLADFYSKANARGFRVDYTAVHWYANPDAGSLISHLQSVKDTFGRAVLLTEFSTVDWGGTATWTEEDNYRFLVEFMWRAEAFSWIKRYGIFVFSGDPPANPWTSGGGGVRGNMFKSDSSTLTAFGELYSAWDGDVSIRDRKAYFFHNQSALHRLRKSSTTTLPSYGDIRRSDVSAQFVLQPAATSNRWYIVSLRDGTRLRYMGTTLEFAPPGFNDPSAEWSYNVADSIWGYYYLDHPSTSKRLKLTRANDSSGAPTSITWSMAANTDTTSSCRWRFIVPYSAAEVDAPPAPGYLIYSSGINRLRWPACTNADFLCYSVYRSTTKGGPYTRIARGLETAEYIDPAPVGTSTNYYVVTVSDWIENESDYSPEARVAPARNAAITLVATNAIWKYYDITNDLGSSWRSNFFNDSTWSQGPAMLGFGDANGIQPATLVASNRQWTTYFRQAFYVANPAVLSGLTARLLRDDGAIVYLNGAEVWRDPNMPSGLITSTNAALTSLGGTAESTWLTNILETGALVAGTNVVAIEVHQESVTSSDLAMNFFLSAMAYTPTNSSLGMITGGRAITWPYDAAYLRLYTTTNFSSPWTLSPATAVLSNGQWMVPLPEPTNGQRYYRLQAQ